MLGVTQVANGKVRQELHTVIGSFSVTDAILLTPPWLGRAQPSSLLMLIKCDISRVPIAC